MVYNPMWINVDELVHPFGGASTSWRPPFITGRNLGGGRYKVPDACQRGGSTLFR